jgi:hypothetical protein
MLEFNFVIVEWPESFIQICFAMVTDVCIPPDRQVLDVIGE